MSVWQLATIAGLVLGAQAGAQTTPTTFTPQFTETDRDCVMQFWAKPGRYAMTPPDDANDKGLWQVRLTTSGSIWLLNYNRARKINVPPTMTAQPQTPEQKEWEDWVVAKIAFDRYNAWLAAKDANKRILNRDVPLPDKTIPILPPGNPGPVPTALVTLAGNPPCFAEIVVPMQHTVVFDDITLTYRDNIRVSNPRYPYYRFEEGVNSEGVSMAKMPSDQVERLFKAAKMAPKECHVFRAVSEPEGGFDAVNTYDTGYISVGFIQFATLSDGGHSLGSFLAEYKKEDEENFRRDFKLFGIDATPNGFLDVLDPSTGGEVFGADAARKLVEDRRFAAVFQRAGLKSDAFNAAQIRSAKAQFWPEDDPVTLTLQDGKVLKGKVSDVVKSEAGLATLLDRKINTGHIDLLTTALLKLAPKVKPRSLSDFAPYEHDIVMSVKYRKNFLDDKSLSQPKLK